MTRYRLLAFFLLVSQAASAQEPLPVANLDRESPVDFNVEVVPFLKKNCFACHNETKAKAKLILETPEAILKGGDSGPAVEPGNAAVSLLYTTAAHIEDPVMPPEKNKSKAQNLTPEELALLKLWVDQGAKGTANIAAAAPKTWLKVGSSAIYAIALSDDGRFAAVGRGHGIQIYDLHQKQLSADLQGVHRDIVQSLAFSSDGTLASGGFRLVKLWGRPEFLPQGEVEANQPAPVKVEGMPEEVAGAPIRIALGETAEQLLTAGKDATIRIYQTSDWSLAKQLPVEVTPAKVVLNGAKTHLLFAAASGQAKLLQIADGKIVATYQPSPKLSVEVQRIQREEAKAKRLSGIYAAAIPKLEDAWKKEGEAADKAGQEIPKKELAHQAKVKDLAAKSRAHRLAEVALEKTPDDTNLQKALEKAKADLEAAEAELVNAKRAIALSIRNRDLAAKLTGEAARKVAETKAKKATMDSAMEVLKVEREAIEKRIAEELPKESLIGVAFSQDGEQVYTATKDGKLEVYAATSAVHLETLNLGQEVEGIEVREKEGFVSLVKGGTAMAWNIDREWEEQAQLGDGEDPALLIDRVTALAFLPDGKSLVTGSGVPSRSGRLKLWDLKSRSSVMENVEAHSDTITEIVLSPDGSKFATSATDKFVKTFDVEALEHLQSFEAHTGHVLGVDWSPDGRHLASASADKEVKLWSLESGEQTKTLKGWSKEVTSVSFISSASEQVLTTSGDKSIKLDTTALSGSSGFLFASTVSKDGSVIAAGGQDGVLRLWTAKDRKLVQSFEAPDTAQEVAAND